MVTKPTTSQAMLIWAVIAKGGEAQQAAIRPAVAKLDREALAKSGLLRASQRAGRAWHLEATEEAWVWAAGNCPPEFPPRASTSPVLSDVLRLLRGYLAAREVTLAEFVRPEKIPTDRPIVDLRRNGVAGVEERIREAYFAMTHGAHSRRALLAGLRERLGDIPRDVLDSVLVEMAGSGRGVLMPIEDQGVITAADRDSAVMVGPFPKHLLWLDR